MLQQTDSRVVAGECCMEAAIEVAAAAAVAAGTDWFGRRPAGGLDLPAVAGLHPGLSRTALNIGRLCERYTFRRK